MVAPIANLTLRGMPHDIPHNSAAKAARPVIPTTPLTLLRRRPDAPHNNFFVRFTALAEAQETGEAMTEELLLLADLIIDNYLTCNKP